MATSALGFSNFFESTLNGDITASTTTIALNSVPAQSEGFLVIEPESASNREIIYYTSKSGSSVVLPSVGAGRGIGGTTAVSHLSGVAVKENTVAEMFEALQDGTGLSSSFVLPTASVKPEDLISGTGTTWVWQNWTPTYANITVGDGTVTAKYIQIGKTVIADWYLAVGSTTALGNNITISLPVTAAARYSGAISLGTVDAIDAGTASHGGWLRAATTTTASVRWNDGTAAISATFPFTEAAGDEMAARMIYEAA